MSGQHLLVRPRKLLEVELLCAVQLTHRPRSVNPYGHFLHDSRVKECLPLRSTELFEHLMPHQTLDNVLALFQSQESRVALEVHDCLVVVVHYVDDYAKVLNDGLPYELPCREAGCESLQVLPTIVASCPVARSSEPRA